MLFSDYQPEVLIRIDPLRYVSSPQGLTSIPAAGATEEENSKANIQLTIKGKGVDRKEDKILVSSKRKE